MAHIGGNDGTAHPSTKPSTSCSVRAENPEWGVRNLEDVVLLAASEGLELQEIKDMPANNLAIIFSKR
jgi:hypothetical protein